MFYVFVLFVGVQNGLHLHSAGVLSHVAKIRKSVIELCLMEKFCVFKVCSDMSCTEVAHGLNNKE
jgi:hypothetical protein